MQRSTTKWAFLIWGMTSLFYGFQFFLRSAPNAMSAQLMQEFHIDASMLGLLSAAYYVPYSMLQIPIGITLDLCGPKKVLRVGTVLCVLGALLFSIAPNFFTACCGRSLIGMGAAVSFIGSVRMNSLWFSSAYLAFATGLLSAMGKLWGGAASNFFLPYLMQKIASWNVVIWALCGWGTFLTLLIWLLVRNGPKDNFTPAIQVISLKGIHEEFTKVLRNPTIWEVGIYGYALYLVLSVFADTYSIDFLCKKLNIMRDKAGFFALWVPVGSAVGASVLSYLSDRLKKRKIFLQCASFSTLFFSSVLFFGPTFPDSVMIAILFSLGFFSGGQVLIFAVAQESMPVRFAGMATGTTNALLMASGAIHNPLVGWLLTRAWDGKSLNGNHLYTLGNYQFAFSSLTFFFALAFVISLFVKETHPKSLKVQHAYNVQ